MSPVVGANRDWQRGGYLHLSFLPSAWDDEMLVWHSDVMISIFLTLLQFIQVGLHESNTRLSHETAGFGSHRLTEWEQFRKEVIEHRHMLIKSKVLPERIVGMIAPGLRVV